MRPIDSLLLDRNKGSCRDADRGAGKGVGGGGSVVKMTLLTVTVVTVTVVTVTIVPMTVVTVIVVTVTVLTVIVMKVTKVRNILYLTKLYNGTLKNQNSSKLAFTLNKIIMMKYYSFLNSWHIRITWLGKVGH